MSKEVQETTLPTSYCVNSIRLAICAKLGGAADKNRQWNHTAESLRIAEYCFPTNRWRVRVLLTMDRITRRAFGSQAAPSSALKRQAVKSRRIALKNFELCRIADVLSFFLFAHDEGL